MTETRTAVITGASSGIGKEAAKALAACGWHVIGQGRDAARSAAAEAEIRAVATGRVDMLSCDLSLLSDTARMADEIAALTPCIDVMLCNAGGMRQELVVTPEGNDASFAGNHLGHFLLVQQLMPQLRAAGHARVISTTSDGSFYCKRIDWDDLQLLHKWDSGASYCLVKLCNVLFTRELARRGAADGIVAHAFHPGVVGSNFTSHVPESTRTYMATLDAQMPEVAAQPLVWLATSAEAGASTGLYWNKGVSEAPNPIALDDEIAARLWAESEKLIAQAGF
ncbi:SDR family NAD(P)-dependent oxidoreductase [Sphingomonas sp. SUN039]|uniref:SDR family NAD(P)-dependent oxidoreductase n=1 Tax=Sphingomonas sp. SUN039 TaxID=2937787 RepID=UPI0021640C5F|nr:SDR family NAD(P)-dependent oxidoreductase [Sphingomonas sp. SUN039]UVO54298.1 SDR family NAD(P)-dependent oxidoreductase [Sphingomonas sp. SUN039]